MKRLALTTAVAAAALGLAACTAEDTAETNNLAAEGNELTDTSADSAGAATSDGDNWQGARIVEENGVTYRVTADGTRVALGPNDSRIVVEDNVRYRVDPDGTRVRIGDDGLQVDIDGPDIDLPDVDVGVNEKGNLDVDVGDRDPDGGR
ncbi:MAG TPA: hypothetical protein VFO69_12420 [Allosphingosinicella sp.]|nr:hypothetical protein [Allosphingosinicella sp.]